MNTSVTGTTTLAESLLLDLDDLSDDEEEEEEVSTNDGNFVGKESKDKEVASNTNNKNSGSLATWSPSKNWSLHLLEDEDWKVHLESLRRSSHEEVDMDLLMKSTPYLSLLQNEMCRAHEELVELWGRNYFPELSDLVSDPIQYHQVVSILMKEGTIETISSPRVSEALSDILLPNQFLTVSVAASTTSAASISIISGNEIPIQFCLNYMTQLIQYTQELTLFVERGMHLLAPNISALVGGATCAAKLLGAAGGLEKLCRMPSCNLQVLGGKGPNNILMNHCDLIVNCRPKSLQNKILRQVANKLALASRCDLTISSAQKNNNQGLSFRQEIQAKLQKLQEPDKAPVVKALPKPDLVTKKRRGGKRMRRLKERFEETELMKQVNRRVFSSSTGEYGDDAMGLTLGMLEGSTSVGMKARKLHKANTKASRKKLAHMQQHQPHTSMLPPGSTSSGLASSMVFTPVQGLELINPNANKDRVRAANRKWFSENADFQKDNI